eukprot:1155666-Pelagomonas_calceolata.AAC.2
MGLKFPHSARNRDVPKWHLATGLGLASRDLEGHSLKAPGSRAWLCGHYCFHGAMFGRKLVCTVKNGHGASPECAATCYTEHAPYHQFRQLGPDLQQDFKLSLHVNSLPFCALCPQACYHYT